MSICSSVRDRVAAGAQPVGLQRPCCRLRRHPAQCYASTAARAAPASAGATMAWMTQASPSSGLAPARRPQRGSARGGHPPRRPAAGRRRRRQRQDPGHHPAHRLARLPGDRARAGARAHLLRPRRPRRCACAPRSCSRSPTRSCPARPSTPSAPGCSRRRRSTAGFDPFFHPVTPADRLALLLDRGDELVLRAARDVGQPGGAAREADRASRPAQGRVVTVLRLPRLGTIAGRLGRRRAQREQAERELEFARFYADHDRMLDEAGVLDFGELILRAIQLLGERPQRAAPASRSASAHVLVDEYQDTNFAQGELLRLLVRRAPQRLRRRRRRPVDLPLPRRVAQEHRRLPAATSPTPRSCGWSTNYRSRSAILDAAHAVIEPSEDRLPKRLRPTRQGSVRTTRRPVSFWRCENERAQAQAVAAELEAVIADGTPPGKTAVLVRSVRSEGQLVATALEERGIPSRIAGGGAFFERAEVRDLLAWLRLLIDPNDARAVVRALMRPPVELSSVDLARTTQIARRRKLDMVSALGAALAGPEVSTRRARADRDLPASLPRAPRARSTRCAPDMFVDRLIERIGLRKQQLFAGDRESLERLMNIAKFAERGLDVAAPQARRHGTRVRRLRRRRRGGGAARGGGGRAGRRADGAGDDDARRQGARVRPRLRAGAAAEPHAGLAAAGAGAGPRRPAQGGAARATRARRTSAEMRRLLYVAMTRARKRLVLAWPETTSSSGDARAAEAVAVLRGGDERRSAQRRRSAPRSCSASRRTCSSAFRALRDEVLGGATQVGTRDRRDAPRRPSRRRAGRGPLPGAAQAGRADRAPAAPEPRATAIAEVNQLLVQGASPEQREFFFASGLDERLLEAERERDKRHELIAARSEPSLESFIPMRGDGVMLSATDIEIYKICPLRYKYARVYLDSARADAPAALRDPRAPGAGALPLAARERAGDRTAIATWSEPARSGCAALFEAGWRRSGLRRVERGAPAPREGGRGAGPLPRATSRVRTRRRSGSSAASPSGSARTCCAAASTASTVIPTARSS